MKIQKFSKNQIFNFRDCNFIFEYLNTLSKSVNTHCEVSTLNSLALNTKVVILKHMSIALYNRSTEILCIHQSFKTQQKNVLVNYWTENQNSTFEDLTIRYLSFNITANLSPTHLRSPCIILHTAQRTHFPLAYAKRTRLLEPLKYTKLIKKAIIYSIYLFYNIPQSHMCWRTVLTTDILMFKSYTFNDNHHSFFLPCHTRERKHHPKYAYTIVSVVIVGSRIATRRLNEFSRNNIIGGEILHLTKTRFLVASQPTNTRSYIFT